jgi:hypothetical protein
MTRLRARIAERLVQAQSTAAMLTTFNEVDLKAVNELRARYKEKFEKEHGARLGFMSFFVRAAVEDECKRLVLTLRARSGADVQLLLLVGDAAQRARNGIAAPAASAEFALTLAKSLLEDGWRVPAPAPPRVSAAASDGLMNLGNTCYMNAVREQRAPTRALRGSPPPCPHAARCSRPSLARARRPWRRCSTRPRLRASWPTRACCPRSPCSTRAARAWSRAASQPPRRTRGSCGRPCRAQRRARRRRRPQTPAPPLAAA